MNEQGRDKRKETKGYIAGIQPKKAKKIFDKMNQVGREFVEVDLPTSSSYIFDQDINKCLEVVEEIIKICIKERVDLIKEENKELSMAYRSVQNCKLCEVIFAPHPTN